MKPYLEKAKNEVCCRGSVPLGERLSVIHFIILSALDIILVLEKTTASIIYSYRSSKNLKK